MKRALISAVVVAASLILNGTVLARGNSGSSSGSSSHSSSTTPSSFNSTKNTNTFSSKNNSNSNSFSSKNNSTPMSSKNNGMSSKGNNGAKSDKGSDKSKFTKDCKSPDGKHYGSGWCFPKNYCPYYSRCVYSSDWGCDLYYIPSYGFWVWFCEADGNYYQICQ